MGCGSVGGAAKSSLLGSLHARVVKLSHISHALKFSQLSLGYTHAHKHTHTHTLIHRYVCVCMHIYIYVCICIHTPLGNIFQGYCNQIEVQTKFPQKAHTALRFVSCSEK